MIKKHLYLHLVNLLFSLWMHRHWLAIAGNLQTAASLGVSPYCSLQSAVFSSPALGYPCALASHGS